MILSKQGTILYPQLILILKGRIIILYPIFRKALLVFPDDTKDYIQSEMAENELKILGSCTVKLNQQKATLLVKKRRKLVDLPEEEEHKLLVDLSRKYIIYIPSHFTMYFNYPRF